MADEDKIGTIVKDPDFQSLPLGDQQQFLSKVDPDFGKLKTGEFSTFLARYKGAAQKAATPQMPPKPGPDFNNPNSQDYPIANQPKQTASGATAQSALANAGLGVASGFTGAPESQSPLTDMFKGMAAQGQEAMEHPIRTGLEQLDPTRLVRAGIGAVSGLGTAGKEILQATSGEGWKGRPVDVDKLAHGVGTGIGTVAQLATLKGGQEAAAGAKESTLNAARRALGTGPELTEDAVKASVENYGKAKAAYESSAQKVSVKNAQTVLDNEMKWADAQNKYKQAVADRQSLLDANREEVTQRASMERANLRDGAALGDNVQSTLKNVENTLTQKYDGVKQAIGNRQLEPETVGKTFANAQEGIPLTEGDAKMVDSVIKSAMPAGGPFDNAMRSITGEIAPPVTTWGQLHELTKNLGRAIYGGGDLPPNVSRALVNTRNGALDLLQMEADKAGVGTDFADTRHAWAEMEKSFRDTSAVSSGGSPLSRMVKAQDPGFVNAQLTGKAADRAIQLLEKYKNFGANPGLARQIIARGQAAKNLASRIKTIPEIKPPVRIDKPLRSVPQSPEGPAAVNPSTLKQSQLVEAQKNLNRPSPIEAGDVSKSGLTGRALDAMKKALVKRIANKAMKNPEIFKALTKVTEGDTSALNRIGGPQ